MIPHIQGIILAAGKSKRFNTNTTKLVQPICGQPMILYTTKLLRHLSIPTTMVVGHQKETVCSVVQSEHNNEITFIEQNEMRGTGHALWTTKDIWDADTILVINGDAPLITESIIHDLRETHAKANATISFVTAHHTDPESSYGRVVEINNKINIVEARHFKGNITEHCCINAGIYLFNRDFLEKYIEKIKPAHDTFEWYITDLIGIASAQELPITMTKVPFDNVRGINTLQELWTTEQIKRAELIKHWMQNGVRFSAAHHVVIDINVIINPGTYIGSGVHLFGKTIIGNGATIKEFCSLTNTILADRVQIEPHCVLNNVHIEEDAKIGPFAHLHNNSHIQRNATIGNFVEIKATVFGQSSKAKHLTYLGDAIIESSVNIGAGTITCNHDGIKKNKTYIKKNAYIGSNNTLIAPIVIGENAFTAAGSTITKEVPADSLAIARAYQVNKNNYAAKYKSIKKEQNNKNEDLPIEITSTGSCEL